MSTFTLPSLPQRITLAGGCFWCLDAAYRPLRGVLRVFEDFRYIREINDPETNSHALVCETTVGGKRITGCDFIHVNDEGLIDDFMVMVRPLSGATALSEAMAAQFPQIQAEAAEAIAALAAKEQ